MILLYLNNPEIRLYHTGSFQHKTLEQLIIATLIHETTHLWDQQINLSDDPYFLEITGWNLSWKGQTRISFNPLRERSLDSYELNNKKEMLAVNMEYFLLDPEFQCRKPTLYSYLANKLQFIPFANSSQNCLSSFTIPNPTILFNQKAPTTIQIDPSRIYQIHYLMADEGPDFISSWGHAMYRIVICAPERKEVGPDCLKDISEHIVVTLRAFSGSPNFDLLNDVIGSLPIRLYFLPLSQVIQEYTHEELRNLWSVPLNLTADQKNNLTYRFIEWFWYFNGEYSMISNNCAIESLNLLRSSSLIPLENLQIAKNETLFKNQLFQFIENNKSNNSPIKSISVDNIQSDFVTLETPWALLEYSPPFNENYFNTKIKYGIPQSDEQKIVETKITEIKNRHSLKEKQFMNIYENDSAIYISAMSEVKTIIKKLKELAEYKQKINTN